MVKDSFLFKGDRLTFCYYVLHFSKSISYQFHSRTIAIKSDELLVDDVHELISTIIRDSHTNFVTLNFSSILIESRYYC